jgi:hypothetical protein
VIAAPLSRLRPHRHARRDPADVCDGAETATADDDKTAIIAVVLCRRQQEQRSQAQVRAQKEAKLGWVKQG